jgi:hypothetical protein
MSYAELLRHLFAAGYTRVERDDRLLDIFPHEDREKGIELWERWDATEVHVLRIKLPFAVKTLQLYVFARAALEKLLLDNQSQQLSDYDISARGEAVINQL